MVCKQCNIEIPKGKKYKSPTHKSISFCCEDCYKKYVKSKTDDPMLKLNEEVHNLWREEPNYGVINQHTKQIVKKYGISIDDIRLIVRYAVLYAGENPKYDMPMLGLYQFIPKYMDEALDFANTIRTNKRLARDWEQQIEIHKIKPVSKNKNIEKKNCEW